MPTNTLLQITPSYELVTRYASAWMTNIVNAANSAGILTTDLYGSDATATNFFSNIES